MCLWEIVENELLGGYFITCKEVSYYLPFFASMSDDIRYETFFILQVAPVNVPTVHKTTMAAQPLCHLVSRFHFAGCLLWGGDNCCTGDNAVRGSSALIIACLALGCWSHGRGMSSL